AVGHPSTCTVARAGDPGGLHRRRPFRAACPADAGSVRGATRGAAGERNGATGRSARDFERRSGPSDRRMAGGRDRRRGRRGARRAAGGGGYARSAVRARAGRAERAAAGIRRCGPARDRARRAGPRGCAREPPIASLYREENDPLISANGTAPARRVKVPRSPISLAAPRNPLQAARASAPPTLIRRTPAWARSATVVKSLPTSTLTGLGATAFTTTAISAWVRMPGA